MNRVTSDDFQKEFASYKTKAHKEAVVITSHDQGDLVLISATEYERLCQFDQKAAYAHELPEEVINRLGTVPIPKETHEFDGEYYHRT